MTTLTVPTPDYTPAQPPAYVRSDATPEYELDDLSASRQTSLHPSQIEACAPKPPPREFKLSKWRPSKRLWIWMGAGLLGLCGLIAAMIWYGVHKKRTEALDSQHASFALADELVRPDISGTPALGADGSLVSALRFSPPVTSTQLSTYNANGPTNYTIFTSSAEPVRFAPTGSTFVKVWGERSSQVTFAVSENATETEVVVAVDALWRIGDTGNLTDWTNWGLREINKTHGGAYAANSGESSGFLLSTSTNVLKAPNPWDAMSVSTVLDWDKSIVFNVTVTVPLSFTPVSERRDLSVHAEAGTTISFSDLGNLTLDAIDIVVPRGNVMSHSAGYDDHYSGPQSRSLAIFAGYQIAGYFSPLNNVTIISQAPSSDIYNTNDTSAPTSHIRATLTFPAANATTLTDAIPATISARLLADGFIATNITSIPASVGSLNLRAASLKSYVRAYVLTPAAYNAFDCSIKYHLAADEISPARAEYTSMTYNPSGALLGYAPTVQVVDRPRPGLGKRIREGTLAWTVLDHKPNENRPASSVQLDAKVGVAQLSFGSQDVTHENW